MPALSAGCCFRPSRRSSSPWLWPASFALRAHSAPSGRHLEPLPVLRRLFFFLHFFYFAFFLAVAGPSEGCQVRRAKKTGPASLRLTPGTRRLRARQSQAPVFVLLAFANARTSGQAGFFFFFFSTVWSVQTFQRTRFSRKRRARLEAGGRAAWAWRVASAANIIRALACLVSGPCLHFLAGRLRRIYDEGKGSLLLPRFHNGCRPTRSRQSGCNRAEAQAARTAES